MNARSKHIIGAIVATAAITVAAATVDGCSASQPATIHTASGHSVHRHRAAHVAPHPAATNVRSIAYLVTLRGVARRYGATDADMLRLGHEVCSAFAAGDTWAQIVLAIVHSGWRAYDAGRLTGAAVPAFCPRFKPDVP